MATIDRSYPWKKSCGGGGGGGGDQLATIISLEPKKQKRAVHSHYSSIGLGPESKVYQTKALENSLIGVVGERLMFERGKPKVCSLLVVWSTLVFFANTEYLGSTRCAANDTSV
jgi:hypothetical protein